MTSPPGLHTLARLHGIQTAYHDNDGRRVPAAPDSLLATLRALGVAAEDAAGIPRLVAHRRRRLWERAVPPVVVVWTPAADGLDGRAAGVFRLRTPSRLRDAPIRVRVVLEDGGEATRVIESGGAEPTETAEVAGVAWVERKVGLPPVPPGYHDLVVEVGTGRTRRRYTSLLIAAPGRAVGWDALPGAGSGAGRGAEGRTRRTRRRGGPPDGRPWGLFAPLYALWERRTDAPATPTYPLLGRFGDAAAEAGASAIGTLPLLAAFLDDPYEPSPYSPVSRLFWNELYVGLEDEPSGHRSDGMGEDRFLDPRAVMAARRPALEAEARRFFGSGGGGGGGGGEQPSELASFRARNPLADDYARFRALTEARGPWGEWPDRLRARDVRPDDYDAAVARYHLYVQMRAERQLAEVAERGADRGVSLYLDLPMGVHPSGYDVWRERSLFALGASAGAPPDPLGPDGQDWGFPPLHPEASRLQGHRYFIASIRNHLRFARILRIDHVMQLHRLYWVPDGDATAGVYVRYPAEELYAILCLESHRAGAVIVGEDLGTVPKAVRRAMRRRGMPGMYVAEFELVEHRSSSIDHRASGPGTGTDRGPELVPRAVPEGALASIGTHDTPTFAGWWEAGGGELRERLARGVGVEHRSSSIDHRSGTGTGTHPDSGTGTHPDSDSDSDSGAGLALRVEEALLRIMGESDAGLVLANVEDLWLERDPQNVPGTLSDRNWRRRAARALEALSEGRVAELLDVLNESREESQ